MTQAPDKGDPIDTRQFPVKHKRVVNPLDRHCQGHLPIRYAVDDMPAFGQTADKVVGRPLIILGHQHAHARIPLLTANSRPGDEHAAWRGQDRPPGNGRSGQRFMPEQAGSLR